MIPPSHAPRIEDARIAVVLESNYIPDEITAYQERFAALGATVDLVSRLFYGDYRPERAIFYSDVDPSSPQPMAQRQQIEVGIDVSDVHLHDYDAIIMAACYTSVRLRYGGDIGWSDAGWHAANWSPVDHVRSAPIVELFDRAMDIPSLIKGFLCHGCWILTPNKARLKGRKLICHSVVMADILNCDAIIVPEPVVVDDDLVTAFSKHEVHLFIDAIAGEIARCRQEKAKP
ncbi:hypothetical protein [Sphingobium sp. YR768]|uniref:hypothetical protein n=1 Tax=Sphingobium sp. YR768 TaxID=1884365 RepID=UPI0008CF6E81|nr:hypothetical protein [Sphingobium sp. YR768]SER89291.1 protease I [Sphingobium sp. YR768]